jgi:hypothetical protein
LIAKAGQYFGNYIWNKEAFMGDAKDSFFDDLKRAYEMEERMAGVLIDLCEPAMVEGDSRDPKMREIRRLLLEIQKDTLGHKEVIQKMLAELAEGHSDG